MGLFVQVKRVLDNCQKEFSPVYAYKEGSWSNHEMLKMASEEHEVSVSRVSHSAVPSV